MQRFRSVLLGLLAALLLGACSPREAVAFWFGDDHYRAEKIVQCESQWNPDAVSPTNDHGLFQINAPSWYTRFQQVTGQPWYKVYDPFWNARFARYLYESSGNDWDHWACRRVL